ncbi:MAG: hypothetical protein NTZ35_00320, partial [Ignavibacteriales bacterium]|nr:hypothetical protein [Ignavibacteriales bacterium]
MSSEIRSVVEKVLVAVEKLQFFGRQTRVKKDKGTVCTPFRLESLLLELVEDREITAIGLIAKRTSCQ